MNTETIITSVVSVIVGALGTGFINWYNKKRDADSADAKTEAETKLKTVEQLQLSAPERAFALLERLVQQQQEEFDQLKKYHYEEVARFEERLAKAEVKHSQITDQLAIKVDKLTADHVDCIKKSDILQKKVDLLERTLEQHGIKFECNSPNK